MDDVVLRAMAKWPNVPAVFGWLSLDRRGRWLLRGEPIGNAAARRFISRNYGPDEQGRWYFQNGPQRVFVELASTPWVYALDGAGDLRTHTDAPVSDPRRAFVNPEGDLLLETEHGIGLVDDRDVAVLTERFSGADGEPLTDEEAERRLDTLRGSGPAELKLRLGGRLLAVSPIEHPARRFGFEPRPVPGPGDAVAGDAVAGDAVAGDSVD